MDSKISAIRVESYDKSALVAACGRHFDAFGLWEELRPGMRVALKPNLLMRRAPDTATTTHPMMIEAVSQLLQDHGITDIVLADSPGGPYQKAYLEGVYVGTGITTAAKNAGIALNVDTTWKELHGEQMFRRSRSSECAGRADAIGPKLCHSFQILSPIADADFVINLPKLKTHAMTNLSGGVKNLFGCVPGLQKPEFHFRFPEKRDFGRMLVDLALLIQPGFTLVDAILSMEGDGPSGGEPRHTGLTLAARNVFTLDLGLCQYIGLPAEDVFTVAHSIADGLCPPTADGIDWLEDGRPEPIPDYRMPRSKTVAFAGHVPAPFQRPVAWVERKFAPRPVVIDKECIGCGRCAESCAPKAMTIENRKARLDMSRCIRCYCCHEMCPVRAIRIRRIKFLDM